MKQSQFNQIVNQQCKRIKDVLTIKGQEYVLNEDDRLSDFKNAAHYLSTTPEDALLGYMTKHIISIKNMVKNNDFNNLAKWDEKLGDTINYCILLKALVIERSEQDEQNSSKNS